MSETLSDYPQSSVVSFDLWLTLIKSNGSIFKTARNQLLGRRLAPTIPAEEFDGIVRSIDKESDRIAERRGADVMFNERVAMVADAVGAEQPNQETIDALYEAQTDLFVKTGPVLIDPDTPQILSDLRQDYEVALISNTGFIHGAEMRQALAGLAIADQFDYMFFSNEVGYAKPDPRMYERLIDTAGVAPHEITHVGDNYFADVEGARNLGMNAIHLAQGMTIRHIVG